MDRINLVVPRSKQVNVFSKEYIDQKIFHKTIKNLYEYKNANYQIISQRLKQLTKEWDINKCLNLIFVGAIFINALLGFINQYFRFGIIIISLFLFTHCLFNWCPPKIFLRWLGIRTSQEIQQERMLLKHIRGDFLHLSKYMENNYMIIKKE